MGIYYVGQEVEMAETFRVSGVPTNPTTVTFSLRNPLGAISTYVFGVAPEVTHPSAGRYVLTVVPTLDGDYLYWVVGTGAVEAASSPGTFKVLAEPGSGTSLASGPCSPWIDGQDVATCCASAAETVGSDFAQLDPIAKEASDLLFELSGRLYAGVCEKTVRPCTSGWCGFQVLSRGHLVGPWDIGYGYGWSGSFWNFPGGRPCGCTPLSRVKLSGYPVRGIVTVFIDGVELPEFDALTGARNWRLDEHRWLTRMADVNGNAQWFPSCQRLDLDDTEVGTFAITYRYGQDPPLSAIHAAEQLSCELWAACTGGECSLPTGTVRVTRQGLTIERTSFKRDPRTGSWATGLRLVDTFLNSFAGAGLQRRPTIWAPGAAGRYARPVG